MQRHEINNLDQWRRATRVNGYRLRSVPDKCDQAYDGDELRGCYYFRDRIGWILVPDPIFGEVNLERER